MRASRFATQILRRFSDGGIGLGLVLMLVALTPELRAHDPGLSTALIRLEPGRVEVQATLAPSDVAAALGLTTNVVRLVSSVTPEKLTSLAAESFELIVGNHKAPAIVTKVEQDDQNNVHFNLRFDSPETGPAVVRCALLERLPRGHRQFVTVENARGNTLGTYLVYAGKDEIDVNLTNESPADRSPTNSFGGFLAMGIHHIVTGYDHLLFLFALLLVSRGMMATLKVITCFTIAHSITLAAATFNLVPLQSRIVEPIIAASIVYVGIENLVTKGEPKWRGVLTFCFGLVHGLGFASVLREMGVGTVGGTGVALPLFSFNLGVELGQLAIAALVWPLLCQLRRHPPLVTRLVPACSAGVILMGGWWFLQRTVNW